MQVIYRFNEPDQLTARIVLHPDTEQPRCWATRQGAHKWAKSQVVFLRHGFFTREYTPLVAEAEEPAEEPWDYSKDNRGPLTWTCPRCKRKLDNWPVFIHSCP